MWTPFSFLSRRGSRKSSRKIQKRRATTRRLGRPETLESRELMAWDVDWSPDPQSAKDPTTAVPFIGPISPGITIGTATLVGVVLKVTGNDNSNTIKVIQEPLGDVRVEGIKIRFAGTSWDRLPGGLVTSIEVDAGGGDDIVEIKTYGELLHRPPLSATVYGGAGNDRITGGSGRDFLYGSYEPGREFLVMVNDDDIINGKGGDDFISGGFGSDYLVGGLGNDELAGRRGADFLFGDAGVDTLWGDAGNDILAGGDDTDYLYGQGDQDVLDGGFGFDYLHGGSETDLFYDDRLADNLLRWSANYADAAVGELRFSSHYAKADLLRDAGLRDVVRDVTYRDEFVNRNEMLTVLDQIGRTDISVSAAEIAEMTRLLDGAVGITMPDHVRVLALNVIKGNLANSHFTGGTDNATTLGQLKAGSSQQHLQRLVDKWFLGADRPTARGLHDQPYRYERFDAPLFHPGATRNDPGIPRPEDVVQGDLGDCRLMAPLAALAHTNPQAIRDMFIDNHDGTFTVRFFNGTKAEYVTVDRYLPVLNGGGTDGQLIFASEGKTAKSTDLVLWAALAEKAYAQLADTVPLATSTENWVKQRGMNAYMWSSRLEAASDDLGVTSGDPGIAGGSSHHIFDQIVGRSNVVDLDGSTEGLNAVLAAIAQGKAVTANSPKDQLGLNGNHWYAVLGYDAAKKEVVLYNPHGDRLAVSYATFKTGFNQMVTN